MGEKKEFAERLKELGIEIYSAAKKEVLEAKKEVQEQFKQEKLRKRFNLENPYKFVLMDGTIRIKFLDSLLARNAKRYDEDDILVFFGKKEDNNFEPKHRIKDLSDNVTYEVVEIVDVFIPVTMDDRDIDVPCTAVYCKVL